jgi:dipeptidyl aminopeptidase/acylaminoacyl peptidase
MKKSSIIALFCSALLPFCSLAQTGRGLDVEDVFRLQHIEEAKFSPNGRFVSYVLRRPMREGNSYDKESDGGTALNDVHVLDCNTSKEIFHTLGANDHSSSRNAVWSPNGRYLAYLHSSKAQPKSLSLQLWDSKTSKLIPMPEIRIGGWWGELGTWAGVKVVWISETEMILPTVDGRSEDYSLFNYHRASPDVATIGWAKQRAGKEATPSALESGYPVDIGRLPSFGVQLLGVADRSIKKLGEVKGLYDPMAYSKNGRMAVLSISEIPPLPADKKLKSNHDFCRYRLMLFDRSGKLPIPGLDTIVNVVPNSIRWSPSGNQLLFIGSADMADSRYIGQTPEVLNKGASSPTKMLTTPGPRNVYVVDFAKTKVGRMKLKEAFVSIDIGDYDYQDSPLLYNVFFANENEVVLQEGKNDAGRKWWKLSADTGPERISGKWAFVPAHENLHWSQGQGTWLTIKDSTLYSFNPATGSLQAFPALKNRFFHGIHSVVNKGGADHVLLQSAHGGKGSLDYVAFDTKSNTLAPLLLAKKGTELTDWEPVKGYALTIADDSTGRALDFHTRTGALPIRKVNQFMGEVRKAQVRKIEYINQHGDSLKAYLYLPFDYKAGQKLPLVAWVYPGWLNKRGAEEKVDTHILGKDIWLGKGYAVLKPVMPGSPASLAGMAGNVLNAVDKAIETGAIDPKKLIVAGQSGGGFGTMGIITQTKRFHAAVALAGMSNFSIQYSTFNALSRYLDYPMYISIAFASYSESGLHFLGDMPWRRPLTYINNSPFYQVENVETPVLLIQGDMDYVSMQNGEAFFTGLYRLGKKARFIRYWGEGHVFSSPANIKDQWEQIFRFLKENGCAPE